MYAFLGGAWRYNRDLNTRADRVRDLISGAAPAACRPEEGWLRIWKQYFPLQSSCSKIKELVQTQRQWHDVGMNIAAIGAEGKKERKRRRFSFQF
jgi:hypothetical protein